LGNRIRAAPESAVYPAERGLESKREGDVGEEEGGSMKVPLHYEIQAHPAAARVVIEDADTGRLTAVPARKKLAIVGAGPSMVAAPFDSSAWLVAGLNELYHSIPRADLWCEMHPRSGPRSFLTGTVPGSDYLGWLQRCPVPVFMLERHPDLPTSVRYPIDQVATIACGEDWFESSFGYLLAWGIWCGQFEEIGVYGIDLVQGQEWEYQRPNAEFWRGVAAGRGIRVTIPEASALGKGSVRRYGYETRAVVAEEVQFLDQRFERLSDHLIALERSQYAVHAALAEVKYLRAHRQARQRGLRPDATEADWLPDLWTPPAPTQEATP